MKDFKKLKAQVKQAQNKSTRPSDKKIKASQTNQHSKLIPNHNRGNR